VPSVTSHFGGGIARLPVAQVVEVVSSAEVCPQATADIGAAMPDSPTWAERVKMEEEELCAVSTSSEDDCPPISSQAPAPDDYTRLPQSSDPRCRPRIPYWRPDPCFSSQMRDNSCQLCWASLQQICRPMSCPNAWSGSGLWGEMWPPIPTRQCSQRPFASPIARTNLVGAVPAQLRQDLSWRCWQQISVKCHSKFWEFGPGSRT